ncbi:MAG: MFS transporter [Gammaproteobacteria bacterium AqS3]|nr:MFS transporter [Gammaproteobacteria bacterium AqS3]
MPNEPKISFLTKLSYGAGAVGTGVKETAFNVFLLFFYTQVAGLPGSLAGAAIFAALMIDAVSDPLVGYWSDRFKSAWGRRHPFMYFAAIPMGICFYLLFHPPLGAGQWHLFGWMAGFAVLVRLFMTFYAVPSFAMIAEMTPDYDTRTGLAGYRILLGWLGGLTFAVTAYLVFLAATEDFGDDRLNPSGYHDFSLAGAIVIAAAILLCAAGTHHLIPRLQSVSSLSGESRGLWDDLTNMFSSRPFRILFLVLLVSATATGFNEVMGLHLFTYFWGMSTESLAVLTLTAFLGTILGFVAVPALTKRYDRKPVGVGAMTLVALTLPGLVTLKQLGLLPENGSAELLGVLCFSYTVSVFAAVAMGIIFTSMIADTVDKNELDTGRRQEAVFSSAYTFSLKATSGLGGLLAGVSLDLIRFPTAAAVGDVPQETIDALGMLVGAMILTFWTSAALILRAYPLSRAEHGRILSELETRRQQLETPNP